MFQRALKYTNASVFQIGGESIIMLIIGILVALILVPLDPFYLFKFKNSNFFVVTIYTLFVILILYLLVFLYHLVAERRKITEHKDIVKLAESRTTGVALRNKFLTITTQEELDVSIEDYKRWDSEMLEILAIISPGKSAWLKTLDTMPNLEGNFLNSNHRRYTRILHEKLQRLDMLLRKYLELPQD